MQKSISATRRSKLYHLSISLRIHPATARAASLSQRAPSSRGRAARRQPRASPLLTSAGSLDASVALCCRRALGFGVVARPVRVHTPGQGRRGLRAAAPELAQRITRARRGLLLPRCVHSLATRRSGLAGRSAFGGRDAKALWADERVAPAHATRRSNLRDLARRGVERSEELEGRHRRASIVAGRGRDTVERASRRGGAGGSPPRLPSARGRRGRKFPQPLSSLLPRYNTTAMLGL